MSGSRNIVIGCILAGLFFRFANIGEKLFWMDEVYTALRVSGYTMAEMKAQLSDGHAIRRVELKQFEFRNAERGAARVIDGLAKEDSHHPPLYFLSLRAWQAWFGSTLLTARYFSALLSLLLFPALFWVCRELLPAQPSFGVMAMALAAVSPVHIVFAQQARPYALWSALILASSAALLRAMRVATVSAWCLYGILLVISLYTHVLSLGVAFAHLLVFLFHGGHSRRQWYAFLTVGAVVMLTYAPWLRAIANAPPTMGFGRDVQPELESFQLASQWGGVICRIVVDLGVNPASPRGLKLALIPLLLPVAALILVSLYVTLRHAPLSLRLLSGAIIVPFCLVYLGSHVIFGRHVATTRHLLPVLLLVELAVAFALYRGLSAGNGRLQGYSRIATALVLGLGLLSCAIRLPTMLWWDQIPLDNALAPEMIDQIRQVERALVVSDADPIANTKMMFFHTISEKLTDRVAFQLLPAEEPPLSKDGYSDIFLVNPTPELLEKTKIAYGAEATQVNEQLWRWHVDAEHDVDATVHTR